MNAIKPLALLLLAASFVACGGGQPSAVLNDADTQLLAEGKAKLDSLEQATWAQFEDQFGAREKAMFEMQKALRNMDSRSPEHKTKSNELAVVKRELIEAEMAFLQARKTAVKEIYTRTSELLAGLDAKLIEIDTTRRTPIVTPAVVTERIFKDYFRIQGNLEAAQNAMVFPELNGLIKSISVKEGQRVSKGQTLMTLDTELVRKQIAEVETSLTLAQDLHTRQKALWDQNIGSEVQYLEAKNRKESLENTLSTLKQQQSMGTVTAPFAGTVDEILPKVGEMASPGFPVARVVNLGELYVEADVSEKHFGKIDIGREVLVNVQGIEGAQEIAAKVSRVGSYIKPDNRTFRIRVDFDQKRTDLIPNLVTELMINDFSSADSVAVLPTEMVLENALGEPYVWILEDAQRPDRMKVVRRILVTGPTYHGHTMIAEGLKAGDQIVDRGVRKVKHGDLVIVSED